MSEEALQIAEKRREVKGKGENKRFPFECRVPENIRRAKEAFLRNNAKIQENKRMGRTRDLFNKIRSTKGIFHAKIGTIKDRNGMDLTEAEYIKKRL